MRGYGTHPFRWVPFVTNHVSEVHSLLPSSTWQHVKSQDNPADLATQGIPPSLLLDAQIWWQGPSWLRKPQVERHGHTVCAPPGNEILERLQRLLRVTAWCLRLGQRYRQDLQATPKCVGLGRVTTKAYIALLVCLFTRAVHLDVVGNYSTDEFIAAFKRFTARRGICGEIPSDIGTNFTGADRELRSMFRSAPAGSQEIAAALADDGTQ